MNVLFWIRKNKITASGNCPIYCRITVNGTRAKEFSTGVTCHPLKWNSKKQIIINDSVKQALLNEIRRQADIFYLEMVQAGQYPSPEIIKSRVRNRDRVTTIKDLTESYFIEYCQLNDCLSTHKKQKTYRNNFISFLNTIGIENQPCQAFGNNEFERFKIYLLNKNFESLTINKHLSFVRNVIKSGVKKGLVFTYNLVITNEKIKTTIPVFLTMDTVKQIENFEIITLAAQNKIRLNKRTICTLNKVRDFFLFQCYTGLAYADLKSFDYSRHILRENGVTWLVKAREKTAVKSHLPLLPKAEKILKTYNYHLEIMSCQKYNKYLGEIQRWLNIKTRITSHVARKTFGSLMINAGVSYETVAAMMGHDKIETTQRYYAKVDKRRVINEYETILKVAA